jgi:hypothetical protein
MVDRNNSHYTSEDGILYNKAKTDLLAFPSASGNVTIPAGVTSIGESAFFGCTSLTSITIPAGVTSIGESAFWNCTSLTSITIPASVTSIGVRAFQSCTSLASITIPESVTSIGYDAFAHCYSLTSITIPAGVTSIGNYAFRSCSSLASITVDTNNPMYASEGGILYNKTKTTLIVAPGGISGSVNIPAGVTSIDERAFYWCERLTAVTIPAGVISIGNEAFYDWTASQTINIQGHASQAAADAVWGAYWRSNCNATINYLEGN